MQVDFFFSFKFILGIIFIDIYVYHISTYVHNRQQKEIFYSDSHTYVYTLEA